MGNKTDDDDTSHYEGAMLEDILDSVKAIAEGQVSLWDKVDSIDNQLNTKVDDLSKFVKEAIKDTRAATNGQLQMHEQRIKRLEHKVA